LKEGVKFLIGDVVQPVQVVIVSETPETPFGSGSCEISTFGFLGWPEARLTRAQTHAASLMTIFARIASFWSQDADEGGRRTKLLQRPLWIQNYRFLILHYLALVANLQ